jgi:hypothetical protein
VRRIQHIDSISFDSATAIKNRNDMLGGIAWNRNQFAELEHSTIRGHESATIGLN